MSSPRTVVFSIEDGVVSALSGGPISIADMGTRTTRRVSHVEHNPVTDLYEVTDAITKELLHSNPDYDAALAWEVAYYNEELRTS